MQQLSRNFSLEELVITNTGLPNIIDETAISKVLYLANYILQPIRDRWGRLKITSGYRSPQVNAKAGGSQTSQHIHGEAADIIPLNADIDEVFRWIVIESGLQFGQAIRESKGGAEWIHISLPRFKGKNQEARTYDGQGYKVYANL